jgi:superfamily II DNA or RNA helicase
MGGGRVQPDELEVRTGDPSGSSTVRLEDLTPGVIVEGLVPGQAVTVVAATWHAKTALTLTWRDERGQVDESLVYRASEPELTIRKAERSWSFDADGGAWKLAAEASRISLAHLFDPMLAVHLSEIEPLPHQIQAVYGEMLPRQPLRFLLADDPGAGKTIMAGLYLKEVMLRGDVVRALIVAPGGLVAQWQDELATRFGLAVPILTKDVIEASLSANPFAESDVLIARLDHLARNEVLTERLAQVDWDLVIVDEAHRMAAHWYGKEVKETRRYRLGMMLGQHTRHLLLLSATPHAGKEDDYELFLSLLDRDRFEGRRPKTPGHRAVDARDLWRRVVKEQLLTFEGRRLFPERRAISVAYPLSGPEQALYDDVTAYVREGMNRAQRLSEAGQRGRGNRVGFALTVLQRRLASSPEAIYRSLTRRRERLEATLVAERQQRGDPARRFNGRLDALMGELDAEETPWDTDELEDAEVEALEDELVDKATAAATLAELEAEITELRSLEAQARGVRDAGVDRKWTELSALMDDNPQMRGPGGRQRKLIVFSEHRDTLNALAERLQTKLGVAEAVVTMHGSHSREERRAIQERFAQDPDCVVLVATDAAGEGINLQHANLIVNYDLPWNPNRIEQRFGRIHRIGQREVCWMWNLVAEGTREGEVYLRLLAKLEEQRSALGGQVFDVLGQVFRGTSLRELLIEAIRYGERPEVRASLDEVIDAEVGKGLAELIEAEALASDLLGPVDLERLRAMMDEAAARRLQPHYVSAFFTQALTERGGRVVERERGRFEVTHVPAALRHRAQANGLAAGSVLGRPTAVRPAPVLDRYERICFERNLVQREGNATAELMVPGNPLLDVVVGATLAAHGPSLRQGTVLVDREDLSDVPWTLVLLEHSISDGSRDREGRRRVISRRFQFVRVEPTASEASIIGQAPYLAFDPAGPEDLELLGPLRDAGWFGPEVERAGLDAAIAEAVPAHLAEVRARVAERVGRTRQAVWARLSTEIERLDARAAELAERAARGRQPSANAEWARAKAEELAARRTARMASLGAEASLVATRPVVVGAALVVPAGWLARRRGEPEEELERRAADTVRVERLAVDAVLETERRLGRVPTEQAHNHPGYDVSSLGPDGHLTFVEVKGRVAGADTVFVTRTEILCGLNSPERFVLALVEVGPDDATDVRYLRRPFEDRDHLHFAETVVGFDWGKLRATAGEPS